MKTVNRIGERLLSRFVPRAEARADECEYEYACHNRASCGSGKGLYKRYICASGYKGQWAYVSCC